MEHWIQKTFKVDYQFITHKHLFRHANVCESQSKKIGQTQKLFYTL